MTVYVYMCICVYVYVCIHLSLSLSIYLSIYIYIYIYIYIRTHTHTHEQAKAALKVLSPQASPLLTGPGILASVPPGTGLSAGVPYHNYAGWVKL